ncbi:Wadjet anti-phage system protein JetD domain-containing protein [Hominiventricola aquisgranensis]|uniref:Wadjet anti-phage system protein JetD domain-containing protein n=1 Tax=Hominiventricola aquisgranensis TaxID=3133164 RepID=A0ABV1HXH0_9FIRM
MAMKQERTKQKIQSLSRYIIEKAECDSYRAGTRSKQWHIEADQKLLDAVGGRSVLLRQAGELEKLTGISGKIIVKWKAVRTEIEKIIVSPDAIPLLCQVEQIEDPRERQLSQMELTESWKSRVAQADWLIPYYDHILERLNSGKLVKDVPGLEDPLFFLFLNKTAEERKPLYRRAFSAQVCTIWNGIAQTKQSESKITPTKRFEKIYQSAVLSVLKQYSPLYEEGMSDEELLTAHGILTYAQTLEFKGAVSYRIDDGPAISTAAQIYGTMFNKQTLENAVPISIVGIRQIMTIENKANYEKMQFRPDTLYIFCHGFFSPPERKFLSRVVALAGTNTEYFHWGDMDYGGIRIFKFLQKNLFPRLKPWKMDVTDYKMALQMGASISLETDKRERFEQMDAGVLTPLKEAILKNGKEIEQELLLL